MQRMGGPISTTHLILDAFILNSLQGHDFISMVSSALFGTVLVGYLLLNIYSTKYKDYPGIIA